MRPRTCCARRGSSTNTRESCAKWTAAKCAHISASSSALYTGERERRVRALDACIIAHSLMFSIANVKLRCTTGRRTARGVRFVGYVQCVRSRCTFQSVRYTVRHGRYRAEYGTEIGFLAARATAPTQSPEYHHSRVLHRTNCGRRSFMER